MPQVGFGEAASRQPCWFCNDETAQALHTRIGGKRRVAHVPCCARCAVSIGDNARDHQESSAVT